MTFSIYVPIHIFYTEVLLLCTTVLKCAHSDIFCRSVIIMYIALWDREVSSAKNFTVDSMFSDKSFIYVCIRKRSGPKIDPCWHICFYRQPFWNLFVQKLWKGFSKESETPLILAYKLTLHAKLYCQKPWIYPKPWTNLLQGLL